MATIFKSLETSRVLLSTGIRTYAMKSDLKIKWIRPVKIPSHKVEKSGDLKSMPAIDKSLPQFPLKDCKELETADEITKRLVSLEFSPRWKAMQYYVRGMVDQVNRHPLDRGSIEARIARWTACIRSLQDVMEVHTRNKKVKVKLLELIDQRKKMLKRLRKWDYKRFEWIIEHMDILYKPPPDVFETVTRKGSLRKLTQKYEDDIVKERLEAYRVQLETEQPAFLQEKIQTLEFIRKEQMNCDVEPTVTQQDIDNVKIQLENLIRKKETNAEK